MHYLNPTITPKVNNKEEENKIKIKSHLQEVFFSIHNVKELMEEFCSKEIFPIPLTFNSF